MTNSCAFTGHRPSRFHFGYDEEHSDCLKLKQVLKQEITKQIEAGVTRFLSGVALGVDMWAALEVLELKAMFPDIRLVAVRPCESQAARWSAGSQHIYYDVILPKADDIVLLQDRYTSDCMFKRNRYLVDNAKNLLAVYDCGGRGGTAYTVEYAQAKGRAITVIQPDTHQVFAPAEFNGLYVQ